MKQEDYYLLTTVTTSITAFFAIIFGIWQIKINERLKKLQDFVAVSISPDINLPGIRIMNMGKINLYIRKIEIGHLVHDYKRPRLISVGVDPCYFIALPITNIIAFANKIAPIRLYFITETGEKYLATGDMKVDANIQTTTQQNQNATSGNQTNQQVSANITNINTWSYKMEKYNWKL